MKNTLKRTVAIITTLALAACTTVTAPTGEQTTRPDVETIGIFAGLARDILNRAPQGVEVEEDGK